MVPLPFLMSDKESHGQLFPNEEESFCKLGSGLLYFIYLFYLVPIFLPEGLPRAQFIVFCWPMQVPCASLRELQTCCKAYLQWFGAGGGEG